MATPSTPLANTLILWGSIAANGVITNSSTGFTVQVSAPGVYTLSFNDPFVGIPSIVGSQTNYGADGSGVYPESPLDNVAFPVVQNTTATAITGDSEGNRVNRSFSFVAIGIMESPG